MKKIKPIIIRGSDVRKALRIPLPVQTGGAHKITRTKSRQQKKIAFKKERDH